MPEEHHVSPLAETSERNEYETIMRELYWGILRREPDPIYLRQRVEKLRTEGVRGGLSGAIVDLINTDEFLRFGTTTTRPKTFAEVRARVQELGLTYLGDAKLASLEACLAAVKANKVAGNFLEFGVALGGSGVCIASQVDGNRRFIGLDVFGMLPPPSDKDGPIPAQRYDVIASGRSEGIAGKTYYGYVENLKEKTARNFSLCGAPVDGKRIELVQGLYEDTLPTLPAMSIAFCHIDCDWYKPVRLCLEYVAPRLSLNGIIVVDDYNDWPGCKKAVDDFCRANGHMTIKQKIPHAVIIKEAG